MTTWVEASFTKEELDAVDSVLHLMDTIKYKEIEAFENIDGWSACYQVLVQIQKQIRDRLQQINNEYCPNCRAKMNIFTECNSVKDSDGK